MAGKPATRMAGKRSGKYKMKGFAPTLESHGFGFG